MTKRTIGLGTALLLWVVLINARPVYAQQPRVGDRQCGREFLDAEARTLNDVMHQIREASTYSYFGRLIAQPLISIEYYGNVAGNVGQFAACIALR